MKLRFGTLTAITVALMGCNTVESRTKGEPESIADTRIDNAFISFVAVTNGCTSNDSFQLQVRDIKSDMANIEVIRTKPDLCRMKPSYKNYKLRINANLEKLKLNVVNPQLSIKK
ncbi:hypothetical protein [Veronia pacifica]|uniref:Lipoprotein n=1 Tax=Veronia pacifica TaxID=1080227 RepID=A0A1C3EDT3_9GAMM|nr:hypothetical protein [Veronia pacifica]ODA31383.1 hypothetical protein A8L45_17030 [Veronia pacifica]